MVNVVCAIIVKNNYTLVVQRSEMMSLPLKWEFPGGKLEMNESEEDCIKREIKEELNVEIKLISKLTPVTYDYPNFTIRLIPFISEITKGNIKLAEHNQYQWSTKENLNNFEWAEADIPILNEYLML